MSVTPNQQRLSSRLMFAPPHAEPHEAPEKIYFYLDHFPAAGMPLRIGTQKAVHGLASGLAANGAAVEIWCEGARASFTIAPEGYAIRCFAAHAGDRMLRLPRALRERVRGLRRGLDLVVLNGMFRPRVYALARKLKAHRIPYIVAPHGPYHPALFAQHAIAKWTYWYLLERSALRNAVALQQLDLRHGAWARRLGVGVPVVASENGFSKQDVLAAAELRWRRGGTVRALYCGQLAIERKGLDVLLEGFERASRARPMRLTFQGSDWRGESRELEQLVGSLPCSAQVSLLPPNFDVPVARVLNEHDIVCLPSRFEGFGFTALEAMLTARVILISASAGIAPHIERSGCGVIVEPTADDVHRGFMELLGKRERWREMGLRGREYALTHLHWNEIARRTLAQYQRLLN